MAEEKKRTNVFTVRNFRLMFLAGLVSEMGYAVYSFAVGFYILEMTDNNAFLQGLFIAVCSAAMILSLPFGGVIGDRFNKVRVMSVCESANGVLLIAAAVMMAAIKDDKALLVMFFAVGVIRNIFTGLFNPAGNAILPEIVEEDMLQQASAYTTIRSSFTGILGSVVAGILYAAFPMSELFVMIGVCDIISAVCVMFIRYEYRPSQEQLSVRLFFSDMKEGMDYIRSQKAMLKLMIAMIFINFFFSPLTSNFAPFFVSTDIAEADRYIFDRVLSPEMWLSVFSILLSASTLIGSAILSVRQQEEKCGRKVTRRLCILAGIIIAVTAAYRILVVTGISLNAFLIIFSISCIVIGFVVVFINIPVGTVMMKIIDRDKLGKTTSILNTLTQCMIPVSSVLAGIVLQDLGSTALLIFCSIGFTAAALMLVFSREMDEI